ncbi:MAG: MFS transporter [Methanospirillaceae archaeon]|nr:MFS transporter [Methanospirillaceae archaeon]
MRSSTGNPESSSPGRTGKTAQVLHVKPDIITRRIVLILAVLAGFITPFDGSAVNLALPVIGSEFHMDIITLSWVTTAYLLSCAIFLVPFGKLADMYGRKKFYLIGIGIFVTASLLMTLIGSEQEFIALRIIQGVGSAMIFGTAVALLTSVYPPGERGFAIGLYTTAVYLGLSAGPFLGGLLTTYLGWRSIFLVNVPLGIIAIALVIGRIHGEWTECKGERFDLAGSCIYAITIVAVMYGLSLVPDMTGLALILFGLICTFIFIRFERRAPNPVLNILLFTENRIFAFSNLAALINYSATFSVSFILSLYLQITQEFSSASAGCILVTAPFMQMLIATFSGKLSDRMDPGTIASVGMGLSALAIFMLVFIGKNTPFWYIIMALVILGIGFGIFSSPNTNAIMSAVEKRYYGVASGILASMRLLGQMFSMGIVMMVFAVIIGPIELVPDSEDAFIKSLHYIFILFTILCIIGIYASFQRIQKGSSDPRIPG